MCNIFGTSRQGWCKNRTNKFNQVTIELLKVCFEAEFATIRALIVPINQTTEAAKSLFFPCIYLKNLNIKVVLRHHDEGVTEH